MSSSHLGLNMNTCWFFPFIPSIQSADESHYLWNRISRIFLLCYHGSTWQDSFLYTCLWFVNRFPNEPPWHLSRDSSVPLDTKVSLWKTRFSWSCLALAGQHREVWVNETTSRFLAPPNPLQAIMPFYKLSYLSLLCELCVVHTLKIRLTVTFSSCEIHLWHHLLHKVFVFFLLGCPCQLWAFWHSSILIYINTTACLALLVSMLLWSTICWYDIHQR